MRNYIFRAQKILACLSLIPLVFLPAIGQAKKQKVYKVKGVEPVTLQFKYLKKVVSELPQKATLGDFYDKAGHHMTPKHREYFLSQFSRKGNWRKLPLPEAKFLDGEIQFKEGQKISTMKFVLNESVFVKINGQAIDYNQLHQPKSLFEKMNKISKATRNSRTKVSFLLDLIIPRAEAFFGGGGGMMGMMMMMMFMPMLMGGGGGGMGGMMSILPMMMMMSMMSSMNKPSPYSKPGTY